MLGLGDSLYVAGQEIRQPQGGRLDMLLINRDDGTRYEVELMLGETDPSHIIRCIEYWDVERKRYPHAEHVAVLVAETVNSRFLNVIGLFNSVIPIIALQMNALRVEDRLVLNFVRVLDLVRSGDEDEEEGESRSVTHQDWEKWSSPDSIRLVDECFKLLREIGGERIQPNYKQRYIGVMMGTLVDNVVTFTPQKSAVKMRAHRLADFPAWKERLEEHDIPVVRQTDSRIVFLMTPAQFPTHRELLRSLFAEAYAGRRG